MDNILNPLTDFITSNKRDNINIKFTLGKYNNSFGFDSQLFNVDNYIKIKNMLESNKHWEDSLEEVYEFTDEHPVKIIDSMIILYLNEIICIMIYSYTNSNSFILGIFLEICLSMYQRKEALLNLHNTFCPTLLDHR